MKERPIIFSGPMVRAILDGRKTQTRRVANPQPHPDFIARGVVGVVSQWPQQDGVRWFTADGMSELVKCPYGKPGDRLWVRETWTGTWCYEEMHLVYAADGSERTVDIPEVPHDYCLPKIAAKPTAWVTPLFMPRWASRITLEITEIRAQRVREISGADALAEGCTGSADFTPQMEFAMLWGHINGKRDGGKYAWAVNPWVWALTVRRLA